METRVYQEIEIGHFVYDQTVMGSFFETSQKLNAWPIGEGLYLNIATRTIYRFQAV